MCSMYRARNNRKRWRTKWPWRLLFPLKIDERFCRECGLPYHEGPLPRPLGQCTIGNVTAHVFPAGGFRQNEYIIRFGRWRPGGKQYYCSEYIPESELHDLLAVVEQARDELCALRKTRAVHE